MSDTPQVSTIIPTHNRADLLPAAIESVLAAGSVSQEVIVVDDSSTDDTAAVAARYPVRYLRVQCGKPSGTRNAGIREARGKYLAFLDDDDVRLPGALAALLAPLEADSSLGYSYGQTVPVSMDLIPLLPPYPPLPLAEGHPVAEFLETIFSLDAVLIRRTALDEVGLLDESLYGAEDVDLALRLARRYPCAAVSRPLAQTRLHPSYSNTVARIKERRADQARVMAHHLGIRDAHRPGLMQRQRLLLKTSGWYFHLFLTRAQEAAARGDRADVRTALRYAWKTSPLHAAKSPVFWKMLK